MANDVTAQQVQGAWIFAAAMVVVSTAVAVARGKKRRAMAKLSSFGGAPEDHASVLALLAKRHTENEDVFDDSLSVRDCDSAYDSLIRLAFTQTMIEDNINWLKHDKKTGKEVFIPSKDLQAMLDTSKRTRRFHNKAFRKVCGFSLRKDLPFKRDQSMVN